MEKKLKLEYNIPNIKIFLSIFGLTLEEQEENITDFLNVLWDDDIVGKVEFKENEILINTLSMYGDINCKCNYAHAFTLTDIESYKTIGDLGLYASWYNDFKFALKLLNGNVFNGSLQFDVKVDNEFGNRVTPHFRLNYQDDLKEYIINFQEHGLPFKFVETSKNYVEKIIYSLFDTYETGYYIEHSKKDKFTDELKEYEYCESFFISYNNDKNTAIIHKKFTDMQIVHNYKEFNKVSVDDSSEEVIHKAKYMNLIDPSCLKKIAKLIDEFKVDDNSFLEKIFVLGFGNYTDEEVYSLFELDKNNVDLEKLYFKKLDEKVLENKVLTLIKSF